MGQPFPSEYKQGSSNWWHGGEIINAEDLNRIQQALDKIVQGMPDFVLVDNQNNISSALEKPYNKIYITNPRQISVIQEEEFNNIIAPVFDPSVANSAGDYVTNNGKMYRIAADRAAGTTWSKTSKIEVTIGAGMKYGIDSLVKNGEAYENASEVYTGDRWLSFRPGRYSANLTNGAFFVEVTTTVCAFCECAKGDKFLVDIYGLTGVNRAWVLYDSEYNVLDHANNSEHVQGVVTIVNDNAAYIAFNNGLANQPSGYYAIKCNKTLAEKLSEVQSDITGLGATVQNEINTTNSVVDKIKEAIGEQEEKQSVTVLESGKGWDISGTTAVLYASSNYIAYEAINVLPGEKYRVRNKTNTSVRTGPYAVVDENYNILIKHVGDGTKTLVDETFLIPSGAKYLLLTRHSSYSMSLFKVNLNNFDDTVPKINLAFEGIFPYHGANVAIIGDSIQTNGNWSPSNPLGNVPEIVVQEEDVGVTLSAYATFYDIGTTIGGHTITSDDVGTEITFIPVAEDIGKVVGKPKNNNTSSNKPVWWEIVSEKLGFNPIPACWSGSSITDHEENATTEDPSEPDTQTGGYIYKCAHAFHPSQIRKCGIRIPGTMTRTAPDMIIIARGGNDLTHWDTDAGIYPARLTNYMDTYPTAYPESDQYEEGGMTKYDFAKGLRMTIYACREAYPAAKIVLCTLTWFRRLSTTAKFITNTVDTYNAYNEMIRRVARHEGCDLIEWDKCGLMWSNAADGYYDESVKFTHPTSKGHKVMANRAIIDLLKINGMD